MELFNSKKLIIAGSRVRYLMSIHHTSTVADVKSSVEGLLTDLEEANFPVTLAFYNEYLPKIHKILIGRKSRLIGKRIAKTLQEESLFLEKTLLSEATTRVFYSVPKSRYNSMYLNEQPNKLLRPGAYEKLSEMTSFDFTSACRCLLYGEATASAFHILRATEGLLKQYYYVYVKTKRLKPKDQTWGGMTLALKARKSRKPDRKLLDYLDVVRIHYRNPTQHPEIKYDIEEAHDLLGLCIDLINKMTIKV